MSIPTLTNAITKREPFLQLFVVCVPITYRGRGDLKGIIFWLQTVAVMPTPIFLFILFES